MKPEVELTRYNIDAMREVTGDVFIDWDAVRS
jgi:hypothetical protein